jgi:ectoine hydroxylase-related dioxygenase (phytanoyl-CoA dioxygenase family)
MSFGATGFELKQYQRDGFFVRETVFAEDELRELRDAVDGVHRAIEEAARGPGAPAEELVDGNRYQKLLGCSVQWEWTDAATNIRSMEPFHRLDSRLDLLIDDPRLWNPVLEILGVEEVSLFTDKLNFKRPGGAPFPWHQDTPYWAFGCDHLDKLVSVGLYLDDASAENGCLWMIPGSHTQGILPRPQAEGDAGRLYAAVGEEEGRRAIPVEAPAGSLMVFHGDIIHGSQPNSSADSERRAIYLTYQPPGLPRWHFEEVRTVGSQRAAPIQ